MRNKLVFFSCLFIVVVIGWAVISFVLSHKAVTVVIKGGGYTAQIRTNGGSIIEELTATKKITLREGEYSYNVIGEGYEKKATSFSVKGDTTITILPTYRESYLLTAADKEKPAITSLLSSTYPSVGEMTITSLVINSTGEWASGKLLINNNKSDVYRFILHRENNVWKISVYPTITIEKKQIEQIPKEIMNGLY